MPLEKQVSCPDKETVRFPPDSHGMVLTGDVTAEGYIDLALDLSDLGFVFFADEVTPFLTQNDSWISTRVSGFVEDVMWSRTSKPRRYSRLTIQLSDGAMHINGCAVITGEPVQMEPGDRYLVFLNALDGPYAIPTLNPIWIRPDGRLESGSVAALRVASLDTVRERIRVEPSRHVCTRCLVNPWF